MATITIHEVSEPAELFHQPRYELEPSRVVLELDLRRGALWADYDSDGSATPMAVWHGFRRQYGIPLLTAEAANRLMRQIESLAQRILADWDEQWDGHNHKAVLGEDGQAAEEELEALLPATEHDVAETDLVAVFDVESCTNGDEIDEYDITATTTDERLAAVAEDITTDLAQHSCRSGVAVTPGLLDYLTDLRDELAADQD